MMSTTDWSRFEARIRACPRHERYRLQPTLQSLIAEMKLRGERVPTAARQLNENLREEAIEAQFDNMPV